jgi:transcriptional regulator with XRE-family HTH domain
MAKRSGLTFGQTIRQRRVQLGLTQREVALRVGSSTPYVGHLEANKRHPSERVVERLAKALDLDTRGLYMSAKPLAAHIIKTTEAESAWDALRKDKTFQRLHNITAAEMHFLSKVAELGEVACRRDFLQIPKVIRHSLQQ